MFEVGVAFAEGGWDVLSDLFEGVKWVRLAAERGHGPAMARLAWLYREGKGVTQDVRKADEWGVKAIQSQEALAAGYCYHWGLGVQRDEKVAVKFFLGAAGHGSSDAQCHLGICYSYGEGVEKDKRKAVEWYTRAAEQGYAKAQFFLGINYKIGQGVEKDERKAVEWYTRAAEQGDGDACKQLAVCYESGIGVTRDTGKAAQWRAKAAQSNK
jgi:TPR repeat protein